MFEFLRKKLLDHAVTRLAYPALHGYLTIPPDKPLVDDTGSYRLVPAFILVIAQEGQEISLHIFHIAFHAALVLRRIGFEGRKEKPFVLREFIAALGDARFIQVSLRHGRLEIIDHQHSWYAAEGAEGVLDHSYDHTDVCAL